MRIAVVGATGLVGGTMLEMLAGDPWSDAEVLTYATDAGGKKRTVTRGKERIEVQSLGAEIPEVDFAFFAVPNDVASEHIPQWIGEGIRIIDKSSVWRLDAFVPLIVPEVNGTLLEGYTGLHVANPNCSTTPLVVTLAPLEQMFGLRSVSVSTYQAVSGAGSSAVNAWQKEVQGKKADESPFPVQIHANVIPTVGGYNEQGYNSEEVKLIEESRKILKLSDLPISATAVRVPVMTGHSEAVEVVLRKGVDLEEVNNVLRSAPGVTLIEEAEKAPTPLEVEGKDGTYVGRVRLHPDRRDTVLMWIVTDNLRKGAATNAIQILERWTEALGRIKEDTTQVGIS